MISGVCIARPWLSPDPERVCRNRHCCRGQKWKGRERFARSRCRPVPHEWWSAPDSQLRKDRSGTDGSRRGPSRRKGEVGPSCSPSLNNRIDCEHATRRRVQRGGFTAAPRQFVIFCFDPWQTSALRRRCFNLRCCVGRLVVVADEGDEHCRSQRNCGHHRDQEVQSPRYPHAEVLHGKCGARARHGCDP